MSIHVNCFNHMKKFLHNCVSSYRISRSYLNFQENNRAMSGKDLERQLQKIRRQRLAQTENSNPSTVTLQVLGSGVPGTPSSLYVWTDHSTYLFNCGEGTQRLAHEHHLRLSKLKHVFFTTPTWKNMGGLPGMALTIQDTGIPEIKLHGPKGITDLFELVKQFAYLAHLKVTEAACNEDINYQDNCMTINYVPLVKSTTDTDSDNEQIITVDETDYYAHEINKNGKRTFNQMNSNPGTYRKVKKTQQNMRKIRGCMAYVCKLQAKTGKLNLEKCVEKGVVPGPMLGQLKNGQDVTLPDGTVIRSADVLDPSIPGSVFIVLECPSEEYLDSLVNNEKFREYQTSGNNKENWATTVIHFTPENIINTDQYKEWMQRFPESTQHSIINDTNRSYSYEATHRMQHKLHLIHPTIFPILKDSGAEEHVNNKKMEIEENKLRIHRAKTLNAFHLRPLDGLDTTSQVKLDPKTYVHEALHTDDFLDALAELQTDINAKTKTLDLTKEYPKLLVLGTGSSIPSKVRNTSGLLLRIDPETSFLFDCGEGTAGQILRFFGSTESTKIIESIKAIFISHLHADHHLGLINILQHRQTITKKPVYLFAPKQIYSWLQLYHQKFEKIQSFFHLIPNQNIVLYHPNIASHIMEDVKETLKIDKINTVEVNHCLHSYGVSLTLENGEKIVYSGDTKPCAYLVDLGQNCDVLIHEATMEDGMEKEANVKMHSTVSQALGVGKQMNAKFILLTHFSQRYAKIPRLPENLNNDLDLTNVGIAFDNMYVKFSELPLLPLFNPTMKILFSEAVLMLEEKAFRRQLREHSAKTE